MKAEEATEVWKVKQQEAEEALALAQMLDIICDWACEDQPCDCKRSPIFSVFALS